MRSEGTELPGAVARTVVYLCADFERRRGLIENKLVSRRTELEYRYLNFKIADAAAEIVGEKYAMTMINEIGRRRGYANSQLLYMSERLYKVQKNEVIINIARRLHLID